MKKFSHWVVFGWVISTVVIFAGCAFIAPTYPTLPGTDNGCSDGHCDVGEGFDFSPTATPVINVTTATVSGTISGVEDGDVIIITITSTTDDSISYTTTVYGNATYTINGILPGEYYAMGNNVTSVTNIPSTVPPFVLIAGQVRTGINFAY